MKDRIDIEAVKNRLVRGNGGYEIVHESPGLEVALYALVAPEPDRQQPHADDELYVVLDGSGTLEIEGKDVPLKEGEATFVPAGAEHRFVGYESLSLLVVFARPHQPATEWSFGHAASEAEAARTGRSGFGDPREHD